MKKLTWAHILALMLRNLKEDDFEFCTLTKEMFDEEIDLEFSFMVTKMAE